MSIVALDCFYWMNRTTFWTHTAPGPPAILRVVKPLSPRQILVAAVSSHPIPSPRLPQVPRGFHDDPAKRSQRRQHLAHDFVVDPLRPPGWNDRREHLADLPARSFHSAGGGCGDPLPRRLCLVGS